MRPAAALANIRQIACLGYGGKAVLPELIEAVRAYVGFDVSSLVWVDEYSRPIDSYVAHSRRPDLHALYLSKFFARLESNAMLSSGDLMRSELPLDSTRVYGHRYFNSDFFDIICRPVDLHHGIRLALRDGRRPLACLVLARPPGTCGFKAADEQKALNTREFLSHALAIQSPVEEGLTMVKGSAGTLVLNTMGEIQHLSDEADRLLRMAVRPRLASASIGSHYALARELVRPLARRLAAIEAGAEKGPPAVHLRTEFGAFSLRAYWLNATGKGVPRLVGVEITRHIPIALKLLGLPRVQALPQREQEICLSLAQGQSVPDIAARLHRSPHTVVTQVKSLYSRFGVSSRNELISALVTSDL